jgi:Tfp pilus assembly protein PilV
VKKVKKGITLIEILVTSLILVIGITSLLWSFAESNKLMVRNSHRINSMMIISEHFEGIRRNDDPILLASYMTNNEDSTFQRQIKNGNLYDYTVTFTSKELPSNDKLSAVTVTVSWGEGKSEYYSNSILSNNPHFIVP